MIKSIVYFLFFTSYFIGFAQQYNFINYSIEDGLIQSQVRAICQDKGGYIWLGTSGGLSKFDGIKFENFSISDSLLDNNIYSLLTDSKDNVIIGSKGGFNLYNGSQLLTYRFKKELKEYYVQSIVEDKNQNLWFSLEKDWIVKFINGSFEYFNTQKGNINHLFCDKHNNIWISSEKGIAFIDKSFKIKDSIININVSQTFIDKDTLWYSTSQKGVCFITNEKRTHITTQNGLIRDRVRGFIKSKNGGIWFYTKIGLSRYFNGSITNFSTNKGLQNANIRSLIEDREGNLFIGTDGAGLIKYGGDQFVSYTTKEKLKSDIILSIIEDHRKNLWFSSIGGGISKYDGNEIVNYGILDGLSNNTVWSSLLTKKGNLLFGTANGISLFDGKKFTNLYESDNAVWSMYEDHLGNIWAGTRKGLLYLNQQQNIVINYNLNYRISKNVKDILALDSKKIWFCSDNGIYEYSYDTKTFSKYSTKDGLPDNFIMSVVKDKNGTLWVGTVNGLAYFKENQFIPVNFSDASSAKFITFLEVDNTNNLWIGTNRGLFQLPIESYDSIHRNDFTYYSNLDGLKGLECNQNSVFIDNKNYLWFGTNKGLMKFNLGKKKKEHNLPVVHLEGVRLFFENINLSEYADSINSSTMMPANLKFKHNQDHLTFDYIGINHSNPNKVRYQFRLEGNDENWSPLTENTYVTYTNLTHGEYTFHIKASNDGLNWTDPLKFHFTITPPYYFTWWFYLLVTLSLGGIIWGIYSRRRKIKERKKETQLIIDKSKILELEHQALNASMNRHFIFNSLNSIQYYINRQDKLSANKYLTSFAKLVRKNLDSSMVNEIVLEEEIERIALYLKLEQMRFKDKFTYEINVDENIEQQSIKIPPMLLQPFIENSIIHGILPIDRSGEIKVNIQQHENTLTINIDDNGIGIEESKKIKLEKQSWDKTHVSKGMMLIEGRIKLVSKLSNKKCFIDGPKQIYDSNNKSKGTTVSIVINL